MVRGFILKLSRSHIKELILEELRRVNTADSNCFAIESSKIHGSGVFSKKQFSEGSVLFHAVSRVSPICFGASISDFGASVNHSSSPNSMLINIKESSDWYCISTCKIGPGQEITLDYRKFPAFLDRDTTNFK